MDTKLCFLTAPRRWHCGTKKDISYSAATGAATDQYVRFTRSQLKSYRLKIRLISFIASNVFHRTIAIKVLIGHQNIVILK